MRRREFIAGLGGASVAGSGAGAATDDASDWAPRHPIRRYCLRERHRSVAPGSKGNRLCRWSESGDRIPLGGNQYDRLPALAADLIRRRVAVIVAVSLDPALVAKATTVTTPIVFSTGSDPVAMGLVASLNRPGANVTGIAALAAELSPKQLQLLREVVPNASRFGVLVDPAVPATPSVTTDLQAAARTLGLKLIVVNARTDGNLETAFATFSQQLVVRSWSASVPSIPGAPNNLRHWRPAMRCPRSTHSVSTSWPAA